MIFLPPSSTSLHRQINDQIKMSTLEIIGHGDHLSSHFIDLDLFTQMSEQPLNGLDRDIMFPEEVRSAQTAIQFVTQTMQIANGGQDFQLVFVRPDGEQNVLFGDFESGAHHGFQIGFVAVLTEAGNFTW